MIKALSVEKVAVACDLTVAAVADAIHALGKVRDIPKVLIAPQIEAERAADIAKTFGIGLILLPLFDGEGWALAGYERVIWSPGA